MAMVVQVRHKRSASRAILEIDVYPTTAYQQLKMTSCTNLNAKMLELKFFPQKNLQHEVFHCYSNQIITNVWYRVLNMGIRLWVIECYFKNIISTMCSSAQCVPAKKREDTWILSFPFRIDGYCQKDILLAKTNNDGINWLSKLCFQIAVRTSARSVQKHLTLKQMVGALAGQTEDSLKENNARQFQSARDSLVEFQTQIQSSMFFTNSASKPYNWLLLSKKSGWRESFLDVFVWESRNIAKGVTQRIQDDTKYYESWCYLYPHLFGFREANPPARIAERYLSGHYQIWRELMSWTVGFNKNDIVSAELRDRVIKDFIGSWEFWGRLLNKEFKSVKSNEFLIATHHVNCTSYMIIHACKYSNTDAARWATDVH